MSRHFEPRIVGFLCNWCAYGGADLAGTSRLQYPTNVDIIRVMCSGRVDPTFVLKAFQLGADGVLICGCHPGDCHYSEGNYKTARRVPILIKLLEQFGIEPQRHWHEPRYRGCHAALGRSRRGKGHRCWSGKVSAWDAPP